MNIAKKKINNKQYIQIDLFLKIYEVESKRKE